MWLKLEIWRQFRLFYDIRGSMACFFVNTQPLIAIETWNIVTMTSQWARWRLKSSASRLFTQMFIQAQIKENIKALRHWPFWAEFTGDRWIPASREMFAFDDVFMKHACLFSQQCACWWPMCRDDQVRALYFMGPALEGLILVGYIYWCII